MKFFSAVKKHLLTIALACGFLFILTGVPVALAQTPAQKLDNQVTPNLIVPLPNFSFSDVKVTEYEDVGDNGQTVAHRIAYIPFLADYLAAIYKYAVAFGGIFATVLMMIGGFQYLIGQSKAGLERIKNATTGLLITFAAFVILQSVNAALVASGGLGVEIVKARPFAEFGLSNTLADTASESDAGTVLGPSGPADTNVGDHSATFADCPIPITATDGPARATEFYSKIQSIVSGGSAAQRVIKIADAAAVCNVTMGCCGCAIGKIHGLANAGTMTKACIDQPKCPYEYDGTHSLKGTGITNKETAKLYTFFCNDGNEQEGFNGCNNACTKKTAACAKDSTAKSCVGFNQSTCEDACTAKFHAPGCSTDKTEAMARAYDSFRTDNPAYPDTWIDQLLPGDSIYIYNANPSNLGAHSVIFMGWADADKSIAQIVQSPGAGKNKKTGAFQTVNASTMCLRSSCDKRASGGKFNVKPILFIFRPRETGQ